MVWEETGRWVGYRHNPPPEESLGLRLLGESASDRAC
jgi:hypothetical protein